MRSKLPAKVFLGFILKYITYCSSILFMRLFVIMGISWIMEQISFFISTDDQNCYFLIFDIWNTLQGVPLFILFVMKRRTWNLIKSRFVHNESINSIVLNNHIEFFFLKIRYQKLFARPSTSCTSKTSREGSSSRETNV